MSNKTVVLFVFCLLQVVIKCQKCDPMGYGYSYSARMICVGIKDTFPNFTKPIESIKCINCSIPVLDENTISNFRGELFNVSSSHVKTIASTAFNSFITKTSTRTILLYDNEITSIAPRVFSIFTRLDEVNLRNNNLKKLENATFENTNVTVLDLSGNHIDNVENIFTNLRVSQLNLSSNSIAEISESAFDETFFTPGQTWRVGNQLLDLSKNLIAYINPNTFKAGLTGNKLNMLYLKSNKIIKIDNDTFSQLGYLTFLSLEDNEITELHTNSFRGLSKLNTLILKNNYIQEIPQRMLSNLLLLENLDLSENRIKTLSDYAFSGLAQMTKFNISHNDLQVLDELCLVPMGKLTTLDVSSNALRTLSLRSIMEHHYNLRVLVLNDNYWTCKDLVQMYKLLNKKSGGFHFTSHHFDVPNLHGIACSRTDANVYNYKSFDDFLSVISQDQVIEDAYDPRLTNDIDLSMQDVLGALKTINGIFYLVLTITLMLLILFLQTLAKQVGSYLSSRKILSDKFSLKYAQNQDTVALI